MNRQQRRQTMKRAGMLGMRRQGGTIAGRSQLAEQADARAKMRTRLQHTEDAEIQP